MWSKCKGRAVENAMDAVGFQSYLGFVVITTIPLVAEKAVLETVDVCHVYPTSQFELMKFV